MVDLMILQQAIEIAGPEACYEVAKLIEKEAKTLAPVDEGDLRDSIKAVRTKKGATLSFGGDEAWYGLFLEYGTRKLDGEGYHGKLPPLPGYSDHKGYPFMRPAIDNIVESGVAINLITGKIKNKWAEGKIWENLAMALPGVAFSPIMGFGAAVAATGGMTVSGYFDDIASKSKGDTSNTSIQGSNIYDMMGY